MYKDKKEVWNSIGQYYWETWDTKAKKNLSAKEMAFIKKFMGGSRTFMDIGVGPGRILGFLSENTPEDSIIMGLDQAVEMIEYCRDKFANESKVKQLEPCDISRDEIPFPGSFDCITAIRVLKYNANWMHLIEKIGEKLSPNGTLIFTMPNRFSINRFSKMECRQYFTSFKRLRDILMILGFRDIIMRGFTKLPGVFYELARGDRPAAMLNDSEKLFETLLGECVFSRYIFIKCSRD